MFNFCRLKVLYCKCRIHKQEYLRIRCFSSDIIRVRFAPSPTGLLHIGGLRTAMYNYLFAKSHKNGKFIVRIEDTDQTRVVPGATENLLSILEWMGLDPDESPKHGGNFGPYVQSERLPLYKKYAEELVNNDCAYYCFCSSQRLKLLKRDQLQRHESPKYDNRCRNSETHIVKSNLEQGKPFVIRLKLCNKPITVEDALFGDVTHDIASVEGDPILLKSDGFPTYHLANVVDDHLMNITHVIRGKEWLTSVPKHAIIYHGLNWTPPTFMHLPLLLNKDRTKLSKRDGNVYVELWKQRGFSPSVLLNFMAYFGSGFKFLKFPVHASNHKEALKLLTQTFDIKKLVLSDAVVDFSKLDEFSKILTTRSLTTKDVETRKEMLANLMELVKNKYGRHCLVFEETLLQTDIQAYLNRILETRKTHLVKLDELITDEYEYLWIRPVIKETDPTYDNVINDIIRFLDTMDANNFDKGKFSQYIRAIAKARKLNFSHLMKYLRMTLSGRVEGPTVGDMMFILGRDETVFRLKSVT